MSSAQAFVHQLGLPSIPNFTPIIFVVDEDISVRASLELLIRSEGWQPEIFESAQEFLARPRPLVPSCLILAISLSDPNSFEVQKRIARERAEVPIIVISDYGDIPSTVQAMKAGAVDFLEKPLSQHVLLAAIRVSLERGRVTLDREMQLRDLRNRYASLTPRERQVMALVVSGLLNKQVGGELGISEITVKAHRGQVMQKMKANSLADLVRMAARLQPARQAVSFGVITDSSLSAQEAIQPRALSRQPDADSLNEPFESASLPFSFCALQRLGWIVTRTMAELHHTPGLLRTVLRIRLRRSRRRRMVVSAS